MEFWTWVFSLTKVTEARTATIISSVTELQGMTKHACFQLLSSPSFHLTISSQRWIGSFNILWMFLLSETLPPLLLALGSHHQATCLLYPNHLLWDQWLLFRLWRCPHRGRQGSIFSKFLLNYPTPEEESCSWMTNVCYLLLLYMHYLI